MTSAEVAKWGQKDLPAEATAIFPPDEPMGWPAQDYRRATIRYADAQDRLVNVFAPGGGITTAEYNQYGDVVRGLTPANRVRALQQGCESSEKCKSAETAASLDTESVYGETGSEPGTEMLSTTGPQHLVKLPSGLQAQARGKTIYSYNEEAPSEGGPYRLVTKTVEAALTAGKEEDPRTTVMAYGGQEGIGWKLRQPTSVTSDPSGLKLTHATVYEPETGRIAETRMPANTKEKSPHATETIYYTTGANTKVTACGGHPEWASLPCQIQPARQPETAGLPPLPVTTYELYNVYDEPEKSTETIGTTTRVTVRTYDNAGRVTSSHTTSSTGKALPTVTYSYTATGKGAVETGSLISQTQTVGTQTQTITNIYNTLGQLISYTDAAGTHHQLRIRHRLSGGHDQQRQRDRKTALLGRNGIHRIARQRIGYHQTSLRWHL